MVIKIKLKKKDYDAILRHCIKELPKEACGLLAGTIEGDIKTVEKVYLLTNTDASREHFSMEPKEQIAANKDARFAGWVLLGNFHSHPQSPPEPSKEDKRLAYDSSMEYFILSLQEREHPVLRAFGIDPEKGVTLHKIVLD